TAIVLKASASTGGTDLLTYIIRSYKPTYRASSLIVIVDTAIVLLNVIFFKEIEIGLYSAIAIYLSGKMIDIVFEGIYFTKMMLWCVASRGEVARIKQIAEEIDPKAFIVISSAREAWGKGFR